MVHSGRSEQRAAAQVSSEPSFLQDFVRETVVTAVFVVGMMVLPVLFRLNKLPQWMITFALYPLYNLAVDSAGTGSTFGPNVLYALHAQSFGELGQARHRFLGGIAGGFLGGYIMHKYFPDDSKE